MSASTPLRVAYVAGAGHSGSTLLALLMDTHPEVASVGETAPNRKVQARGAAKLTCSCGELVTECPFWLAIFARMRAAGVPIDLDDWRHDHRYKNELLHRLLSRYSRFGALRRVQRLAEQALPSHRGRIDASNAANIALVRAVLQESGAKVFFDTSKHMMRLHHLMCMAELDLRIIAIARDVRGFVASAKRRGRSSSWAATTWKHHQQTLSDVLTRVGPTRVLQFRYESFCADPRTTLLQLFEFLGVNPIEPTLEVLPREHHILGNRMRKDAERMRVRPADDWRPHLTADEERSVLKVAGEENRRLGYE